MDTLALLCNLHADGPATLQRLRRSGCETLVALGRMAPAELAARLDWTERVAERFLREAALLAQRVEHDDEGEGAEPGAEPEFELESTLVEELDGDSDESEHEDEVEDGALEELEAGAEVAEAAPPPERVEVLLGAWRELDRVAPPEAPAEYILPRPAPATDRALGPGAVAGLSDALCARLAALGVRTLRELVGAEPLALARRLPAGFTRVKHFQFLAERALARLGPPAAASAAPGAPGAPGALGVAPAPARGLTPPAGGAIETAGPFA